MVLILVPQTGMYKGLSLFYLATIKLELSIRGAKVVEWNCIRT
jgi:hypothetical protein